MHMLPFGVAFRSQLRCPQRGGPPCSMHTVLVGLAGLVQPQCWQRFPPLCAAHPTAVCSAQCATTIAVAARCSAASRVHTPRTPMLGTRRAAGPCLLATARLRAARTSAMQGIPGLFSYKIFVLVILLLILVTLHPLKIGIFTFAVVLHFVHSICADAQWNCANAKKKTEPCSPRNQRACHVEPSLTKRR